MNMSRRYKTCEVSSHEKQEEFQFNRVRGGEREVKKALRHQQYGIPMLVQGYLTEPNWVTR